MSTVQAVAGATADEFVALREEAQRLGATTRFSATEAAQAMGELARAGFSVNETLKATSGTLQLAQAGGLELARAAEIAGATLRGFRLEVEDLGRVNDVLALAANATNTSVEGLGQGMKFVAPIAAGLGVSLESTAAALGTLANKGLDAGLAGRGLRGLFDALEAPSDALAARLLAVGVSTDEVRISSVGLAGALDALNRAGIGATEALDFFEVSTANVLTSLTASVPELRAMEETLRNAEGTAERTARVMDDNLNGALLALRAAAQALVLELGDAGATGTLRKFVGFLTQGLRFATEHIEEFSRALEFLAIVMGVKLAGQAISAVVAGLNSLKVALLTNPISLLPTILAAAIAALITFREEIAELEVGGKRVGDVLQAAFNVARERFEFLVGRFKEALPIIRDVVARVIDFFVTGFQAIVDAGKQFAGAFLPNFESVFGDGSGALGILKKFANVTIGIFKTVGDVIQGVIDGVVRAFANLSTFDISSPFESLKRITSQTFTDIGNVIDETLDASQKNFSTDYVGAFADTGKRAALALTDGFKGLSGAEALAGFLDFEGSFNEELAKVEGQRIAQELLAGAKSVLEKAKGFLAQFLPTPETPAPAIAAATEEKSPLSPKALEVLQAIQGPQQEFVATQRALNELLDAGKISAEEYSFALNDAAIAANVASSSMSKGLAAGLAQVENQLRDVSGAVSQTVVNAFGRAEDAIVEFATTGEVNFSAFVDGLLADVARILARKALLALLDAFTGGGASAGEGIIGAIAGAKAEGGPVDRGETYLVGEKGPELFTPPGAGTIVPAGETAARMQAAAAPVVNVTTPPPTINIVNVNDPNEVPSGIESPAGEQAVLNVLSRNKRTVKNFAASS